MIAADDYLQEIEFFLAEAKRNAALRLPKDQELLAADLAVDGFQAWGRLYDRISGALRISVMEKGEVVKKSVSQVQYDMPERPVRENNFYAADKAWNSIADTCADAINHIAGTRLTRYRRLGLQDHLDAPLRANRLQRKTLESMWSAISSRKQMMVDYLDAKARLLGIEKLAWYDQAAPLPAGKPGHGSTLSWEEACRVTIETFHGFSPDLGQFAERALAERWIEAENRPGKRQGGFCTDLPIKKQSRIFMTFTNSPDSMSTLAHELGHAYHSHVLRDRPVFLRDYPMNLAETASTFAEAVLGEERLARARSNEEKLSILDGMLGDAVAFLMNIHCRFLFEDAFHRKRAEGELSAEELSDLMLAAQKEAYAEGLSENGYNPRFWASKLHFYITELPFYNFPYTFGYLLSLGVYAMAPEMGKDFSEQYKNLLTATGCQETEAAVQSTLGQDLTTPDFWNKSLDIVERRVERYKELAAG
jgi:oligoendopeptidase F